MLGIGLGIGINKITGLAWSSDSSVLTSGSTSIRKVIRDEYQCVDKTIGPLGFGAGSVEGVDWETVDIITVMTSYWTKRKPSNPVATSISATEIDITSDDAEEAADGLKIYVNGVYNSTVAYGVESKAITGLTEDTYYTISLVAYRNTFESDAITVSEWTYVALPAAWSWSPLPFGIKKVSASAFGLTPSFDLETYADIAVAKTYYVNWVTGNDGNDGLTAGTALKKLTTAVAKADVDKIVIAAGWYTFDNYVTYLNPARSIKMVGTGNCYLTSDRYNNCTGWALVDSHYEASFSSAPATVIDSSVQDSYGDFKKMSLLTSIANVDSTPGSVYFAGGKIYLRLTDSRVPDANVKVLYGTNILSVARDNLKMYFENIKFYTYNAQFVKNASSTGGMKVYFKNCDFMYSGGAADNINIQGVDECIFWGCKSAHCNGDGFSTAILNTVVTKHIEYNCQGYDNGAPSGTQFNGSTIHEGSLALRISSTYQHNRGSNIHDVDNGQSWLLGCSSHNSEPVGTPANYLRANFASGYGASTYEMWCDTCVSTSSFRDYVATGSGVKLHKRNCTGDASDEQISSGVIDAY